VSEIFKNNTQQILEQEKDLLEDVVPAGFDNIKRRKKPQIMISGEKYL
jgi:hypothetical protein